MEQEAIIEPKKSIIHFFPAGIFFLFVEIGQLLKLIRTISVQSLLLYWYSCYSNLVFLRMRLLNQKWPFLRMSVCLFSSSTS